MSQPTLPRFDNVSVIQKANVFFDGKCVSHTVFTSNGEKKSVGVILPGAQLTFNTASPEKMECVSGRCRARLPGAAGFKEFGPGESFSVKAGEAFVIEAADEPYHYVCHFG